MTDIKTNATGLRFPEGPVAMKDGSIVLVEIERQTVTRVRLDGMDGLAAHKALVEAWLNAPVK